ncbi:hydratase [Limnohabitans sp. Rim8]|uniref:2-keto-4-pentenoate hydratase n=1 Tax=Limnohabitans sp. Rim8 TaxID=1100718 RepID=UPI0033057CD0
MTPETLLQHIDNGKLWTDGSLASLPADAAQAYQTALQVRQLRVVRGEQPRGFKIGFTNRSIWERYQVFEPIWGTVWNTTLSMANEVGECSVDISRMCQPRLEPELVFAMRCTPPADLTLQSLFESIEWMSSGFEVVQSHAADWKFKLADTITDSGLHAHLVVGKSVQVANVASSGEALHAMLVGMSLELMQAGQRVEKGAAFNVLDSPLMALLNFMKALRSCPGAPDVQTGDVITTGTWTDAWPLVAGQVWQSQYELPLVGLTLKVV